MKLKNVLLVVRDMEQSREFYRNIFEMESIADFGNNVILTDGMVLQEQKDWEAATGHEVLKNAWDSELYFETYQFNEFLEKLKQFNLEVPEVWENPAGRRVVRLTDPDGHVLEVAEIGKIV